MVLTSKDRAVIERCFKEKGWRGRRIVREFPNSGWQHTSIDRVIKKIINIGSTNRKKGSGRPRKSRIQDNIDQVETLVESQEDEPGTHLSQRKIAQTLNISTTIVSMR